MQVKALIKIYSEVRCWPNILHHGGVGQNGLACHFLPHLPQFHEKYEDKLYHLFSSFPVALSMAAVLGHSSCFLQIHLRRSTELVY